MSEKKTPKPSTPKRPSAPPKPLKAPKPVPRNIPAKSPGKIKKGDGSDGRPI